MDSDSFDGDTGTFNGLDPIRISFTVRNAGGTPVQPDEDFFTQVALSKDLTFDDEDFVLKEFDLSGDALGSNLLAGVLGLDSELPDNVDGDFYFWVSMENNPNAFPLENTPSISLTSSFTGTTNLVEVPRIPIEKEGRDRLPVETEGLSHMKKVLTEISKSITWICWLAESRS